MLKWDHTPDYVNRPLGPRTERDGKYDGFGFCIYCGATRRLKAEHIIPEALGSHLAIREASCSDCEKITHAVEGHALSSILLQPRLHTNLKKTNPKTISVSVMDGDTEHKQNVRPEDYHIFGHFPIFLPSRIVLGIPPDPMWSCLIDVATIEDMDRAINGPLFGKKFSERYTMKLAAFSRMIAKIAYCFAIVSCGIDSFTSTIPDYVLGKIVINPDFYVGTDQHSIGVKEEGASHRIGVDYDSIGGFLTVVGRVRFFAWIGSPTYHVVLGRAKRAGLIDL